MRITWLLLLLPILALAGKYDLHDRAKAGDVAGIRQLADAKNINRYDKAGSTAIHYAAANADAESIKALLAGGANVNLANEKYGTTALHEIARSPSRSRIAMNDTVHALADAGADPALRDNFGDDALTAAARVGNGAVVRALLNAYADAMPEQSMQSALGAARERGQFEVISVLKARGTETDAGIDAGLLAAAATGNYAALLGIVEAGANLETSNESGATALLLAVENEHRSVAELLLASGARIDATQHDGQQSLHLAAHRGNLEIIDLLLANGGALNGYSPVFGTPLNRAAEREQVHVVEYLLGQGAVPASVEGADETAFGSGLAWMMYAGHHKDRIDEHTLQQHRAEAQRLLGVAREKFVEQREVHVELRKKEKRSDFWTDAIAGGIAMTAAATMQHMQQQQIQTSQHQMAEIAALKGATSYGDYHSRLSMYEHAMVRPDNYEPYQLDFSATAYANTESTLGLDVIISEYDRRIALVDTLLEELQP